MCSKVSDHQLKTDCYIHKLFYMNLMVITNQKSITETQKNKEKGIQTQHKRKSSNHKGREQEKEQEELQKQKIIKMPTHNIPINDYFDYKWTKGFQSKVIEWLNE